MKKYKHIIQIQSYVSFGCPFCSQWPDKHSSEDITETVNHYIQKHSCDILYVGGLTTEGINSEPRQDVIAILGSSKKPPKRNLPDKIDLFFGKDNQ